MREDFLHYVWQHKKFEVLKLQTTSYEKVEVISVGQQNLHGGPDFFNAQLIIGEQLWAGNVEIHIKTSVWYAHNHESDSAYDNVILHVVWEHDTDIFRADNSSLPTLILKDFVKKEMLNNYKALFNRPQKWINCEKDLELVDDFVIENWLERLYFERLERKSNAIEALLKICNNDWEAVLFKLLVKNFGLNVNGEAFLSMANSFEFSIFRKLQSKPYIMEALCFGQAGLLENNIEDPYYLKQQREYNYLVKKFELSTLGVLPIQFFRLRPANFPTIRLSQLVSLYASQKNLCSEVISIKTIKEAYDLFAVGVSPFWETHYTFERRSKASPKKLTKAFINLIIINTIIPFKFSYAQPHGKSIDDNILNIIQNVLTEKNTIVDKFNEIKHISKTALQSQSLIQLKKEYCDKNRCLQCEIGSSLLNLNM